MNEATVLASNIAQCSLQNPLINTSLLTSIFNTLKQRPSAIAVEYNSLIISNTQFLQKILQLSQHFKSTGIDAGMHIGVFIERSPESLVCLFALWHLHAVYVPLDIELPKQRLDYITENADLKVIITHENIQDKLNGLLVRKIILNNINFNSALDNQLHKVGSINSTKNDNLAYILYTSGSTGKPKGVAITHDNLITLFNGVIPLLNIKKEDVFLGIANFSFDICFFELISPFLVGGKLILLDEKKCREIKNICDEIKNRNINIVQATPSMWKLISTQKWNPEHRQITAISTGEALPIKTAREILRHNSTLWNLYGPTETTIWATARMLSARDVDSTQQYVGIGKAVPGYQTYLLNKNKIVIKSTEKEKGELYIAGDGLAKGYYNNPELTKKNFVMNGQTRLYKSGDICSWRDNGELNYHGRKDNQVKVNGYRIELEEIELILESHPVIKQAIVSTRCLNCSAIDMLVAYIVYEQGSPNKSADTLNLYLRRFLPGYMLPYRYFFIDSISLTSNGKKCRKYLPENTLFETRENHIRVKSTMQQCLAKIFCDILEIENIGLYDSFFDAGGNSMLSASLLLAVNKYFSTSISLKTLLLSPPTVFSVSKVLQEHEKDRSVSSMASEQFLLEPAQI